MKNYKLHISEGYRDTFGKEMLVKKEIEYRILKEFKSFGYELIKTPTVEYIDVYSTRGMQKPDLYNLINRQGEVLALCNDMTSSIARFVSSNHLEGPLKYCYTADVFRYPKLYQGKNHQFLQGGIEFIGAKGIESDIEAIYLAYKALKACNAKNFTIHIGSAKFLNIVLEDFKLPKDIKENVYMAIENKDYVTLNKVLHDNINKKDADFIIDLMLRGGKLRYIENLMLDLKNTNSFEELAYLKKIYMTLKELEIDNIIFDFSIYSYAGYYTGIIFSVYMDGISKAVIEGGRCDDLFKNFGNDLKNIGFGLDIDALTTYTLENNLMDISQQKYLSYSKEDSIIFASKTNNHFREDGIIVNDLAFNNIDEAMAYAKFHHYDKVIEYKENSFKLLEVELC